MNILSSYKKMLKLVTLYARIHGKYGLLYIRTFDSTKRLGNTKNGNFKINISFQLACIIGWSTHKNSPFVNAQKRLIAMTSQNLQRFERWRNVKYIHRWILDYMYIHGKRNGEIRLKLQKPFYAGKSRENFSNPLTHADVCELFLFFIIWKNLDLMQYAWIIC